jgi:hypothetical protein
MRTLTDQEKKMNKFSQISDKLSKTNERLVEVEALKKRYSEKNKELEKENKELLKETMILRERNEKLSKENAELRTSRVANERALIDKVKQTEAELARMKKEREQNTGLSTKAAHKLAKKDKLIKPEEKQIEKDDWRFENECEDDVENWPGFESD